MKRSNLEGASWLDRTEWKYESTRRILISNVQNFTVSLSECRLLPPPPAPCSEADPEERPDPRGGSRFRFNRLARCRDVTIWPPLPPQSSWKPHPQPPEGAAMKRLQTPPAALRLLCPRDDAAKWVLLFLFAFFRDDDHPQRLTDVSHSGMKRKIQLKTCFFQGLSKHVFQSKGTFFFFAVMPRVVFLLGFFCNVYCEFWPVDRWSALKN